MVRHPISRLLSGYLDKIVHEAGYGRIPYLQDFVNRIGRPPTFAEFFKHLKEIYPDPYDPQMDPHFAIQSSKCGLRDHKFDFIASLENLEAEIKELALSLDFYDPYITSGWGEDGKYAFGTRSFDNHSYSASREIWKHYTIELMLEVYEYFKDDFINFGYTLDALLEAQPTSDVPP